VPWPGPPGSSSGRGSIHQYRASSRH